MPTTIVPSAAPTLPPSEGECAYSHLLALVTHSKQDLALACAMAVEGLDSSCAAELAERLYNAVKHS